MPLVFAMNDESESDHVYDDRFGISYEYPQSRYQRLVRSGELFVYYRGRKKKGGGRQPQVYLGAGVVGPVRPSPREGRLVCEILDFQEFESPVPFKDAHGAHLEPNGGRKGYYRPGVRRISEDVYERILGLGGFPPAPSNAAEGLGTSGYADPGETREVEDYAVDVVTATLAARHPDAEIEVMARNNPGFDIHVRRGGEDSFVEVKGTRRPAALFHMSEGERLFSHAHAEDYSLFVVFGINLAARTHAGLVETPGPVAAPRVSLEPRQWVGEVVELPDE
ncbi:DUF3883 domain-containing protein [Miltoncostaea marina]|uniref:DUF3883 domain-containing protein n=1 Tax=Miltoncostaea marina TaxID=2843215 RepID=UPI001C3E5C68|nr:DUF3883 domain-containing protein [Miltoncostaea marina]